MTTKKTGPKTGVTEEGLRWEEAAYNGVTYRIREVLVDEADTSWDASLNPDKTINLRMNSRLNLCSAIIDPKVEMDEISKWPNVKLGFLLGVYDRVNGLPPASAEGEDSAPAT